MRARTPAGEESRKGREVLIAARSALSLAQADLAVILDLDRQTVVRYEMASGLPTALSPSPFASRALDWMLGGFEPPELAESGSGRTGGEGGAQGVGAPLSASGAIGTLSSHA